MADIRKKAGSASPSTWHIKWQYKTIILMLGLIIAGLICLAISLSIAQYVFWSSVLSQVSTALIISGAYTMVSELLLKNDFINTNKDNLNQILANNQDNFAQLCSTNKSVAEQLLTTNQNTLNQLINQLHLAEEAKLIGLESIVDGNSYCDETHWLLESKNLQLLLVDGKSWVSHYNDVLRKRFKDPEKTTTFILLHPESPMLSIHADKVTSNREALQQKIAGTVAALNQLRYQNTKLQIKGHHLYNTYSLLLSDTHAVMSPYFCAKEKKKPPIFIFQDQGDDSYYQKLKQDLEFLESEAEDISNYTK
ncbi:MAG: hypothetical protein U7127_05285 [Phormidium sp.]